MPHTVNPPTGSGKRVTQVLTATLIWMLILFLAAGRWDWARAWLYFGLSLASMIVSGLVMDRYNPGLAAVRSQKHTGTKRFDQWFRLFYTAALLALPIAAGLAMRWHGEWLPWGWAWAGAVLFILGSLPVTTAMASNPYLEVTVRIQNDRGHHVVDQGPYRLVRHPMYAGAILQMLATPMILGTAWAFPPALAIVMLFVIRTGLEDAALRRELPGYAAYSQKTRFRLLPGIW